MNVFAFFKDWLLKFNMFATFDNYYTSKLFEYTFSVEQEIRKLGVNVYVREAYKITMEPEQKQSINLK